MRAARRKSRRRRLVPDHRSEPRRRPLARGGRFGIGTDSNVAIDLADELRLLEYGQRLHERERNVLNTGDGRSTGRVLFDGAVAGGAQALGANNGVLAPGRVADIVALTDAHPSMAQRRGDAWLDAWIFAGARAIECVWSGGRKVVAAGRHLERDRIERAYVLATGDWPRP
jgi:formimidoylglutamate deiminase